MMKNERLPKLENDIQWIKAQLSKLTTRFDMIMMNDLPHIRNDIVTTKEEILEKITLLKGEVSTIRGMVKALALFNVGAVILIVILNRFL